MLTNYVGELVQHDTSVHLWAPEAQAKWYLITSIDDYSRDLLYADLWPKETSWAHIVALKTVVTHVGCPLKYYVDNHAIFRFIEKRDTVWQKAQMKEEEATVQWKEVLNDLGIDVVYALSPAAKGKIERPYRWLQDHLVRTCVRDGITTIEQARDVLTWEVHQYRYKRVHSTTGDVPSHRMDQALQEQKSLFRAWMLPPPYQTLADVFCYRFKRRVDSYRKVSFHTLRFSIHGVPIREEVELRVSLTPSTRLACIRFWYQGRLVGQQEVKAEDLPKVHF